MSWEKICTRKCKCPCGKGVIKQDEYGDDWGRYQDGPVVIDCEECSKKYQIEEVEHRGLLASDGCWSTYYLTPQNYPHYKGASESAMYGHPVYEYEDFVAWLIENYTEKELLHALSELKYVSASTKLKGYAARITRLHKKYRGTIRLSNIITTVEAALAKYPEYVGNKLQRETIREKERLEMSAYIEEKRKHQILLDLR